MPAIARGPKSCIEYHPDTRSVMLGGRYINITLLADVMKCDHGYLCRILRGERTPSIPFLRRMADALSMTGTDELLAAIDERVRFLKFR